MRKLSRLFEPIMVGNVELKNRLVMLGMSTGLADNYRVGDRLTGFVRRSASGGVGLITLGCCYPSDFDSTQPLYTATPMGVGLWSDEFIPGLRTLTQAAHDNGAKISCQMLLNYEWRLSKDAPLEAVGPSEGPGGPGVRHVRELTIPEIHQIVEHFGEATRRAREAGFDMVEFHAGIGYFINRFLSSYSNKRTDEYGGDIQKRLRFFLEIIDLAKKKAGNDYTCICRISADEFMDGGNTIEDTRQIVPVLEKAGIAAFNVQMGWHESTKPMIQQWVPAGAFVYAAEEVKKLTSLPVVAAYRIDDPVLAEEIVAKGRADLVGMGRALLADPELPNKAREGRFEDIRRCLACCRCIETVMAGSPVVCSVNAGLGVVETPKPTPESKRVVVIGSGPAGMEAARVAAMRGHKVILCEKDQRLGGLMILGAVLNDKLENLVKWMSKQVKILPIDIKLGTEVTPALLESMKPDVLIVAPGGEAVTLEVPGIRGKNVIAGYDIKNLLNGISPGKGILWGLSAVVAKRAGGHPSLMRMFMGMPFPIGKRVTIIGGQFAGCELALTLMEKGKKVTILEESKRLGSDIGSASRWVELDMLKKGGVKMETLVKVKEITDKGVRVIRAGGGEEFFESDTVILALGLRKNSTLVNGQEGKLPAVYLIGDATGDNAVKRISGAIASGFEIGNTI
ncbi:MAG: NAD(P)/FAD-dependent oxidoreductase [Dehalococcoidia bacterium]|nr:NAD(P)/FAD-dependent oxidoreductase [Dehalococcoidia bacterium]